MQNPEAAPLVERNAMARGVKRLLKILLVLILLGAIAYVSIVLMVTQFVFFAGGAWAGWRFFQATETLTALRFGLPSAVLLTMALMMSEAGFNATHVPFNGSPPAAMAVASSRRSARIPATANGWMM